MHATLSRALLPLFLAASACGNEPDLEEEGTSLLDGAAVATNLVYQATEHTSPRLDAPRPWIPVDLSATAQGDLWAVMRLERHPDFTDQTECTSASQSGGANDCAGLIGSTVAITGPELGSAATEDNGRAQLVIDYNAWHFMRRPSAIAFGAEEAWIDPDDPGAIDRATGESTIDEPTAYPDTFATCSEHFTGNFTNAGSFNGPSLWTADPDIYDGTNGPYSWSNGSHLDMVHGTEYCMGIAWDQDNAYWTFNGALGTIDHYDFGAPHVPGQFYHGDSIVTRLDLGEDALERQPDVPSNLVATGSDLYIADSGNGRLVHVDVSAQGTGDGPFYTAEGIEGEIRRDYPVSDLLSSEQLAQAWGGDPMPSGLASFDLVTLVVGDANSGNITFVGRGGEIVRTLDTGLGAGMGGITVVDEVIYIAHTRDRAVYRLDVLE